MSPTPPSPFSSEPSPGADHRPGCDSSAHPTPGTPPVPRQDADLTPLTLAHAAAVDDARRLFQRTLAGWAIDLLELRRSGRHEASWHGACNEPPESETRAAA